ANTNPSPTGANTNPSLTVLIQTSFSTDTNTNFSSTNADTNPFNRANYIIVEDSDSSTNSSLLNSDLDFFDNLDFSTNYILSDNSLDLHLDNSSDLHLDNSSDLHLDNSLDLHLELQAKELLKEDSDYNKETSKKKSKKLKTNHVPKESNLTSNEIKLANIISQIRTKYQCHVYPTPCYIEDNKHLQLMPARLHLWAQDEVSIR
ncbi:10393_t:CDS:2, partial [Racocetra fulgida]